MTNTPNPSPESLPELLRVVREFLEQPALASLRSPLAGRAVQLDRSTAVFLLRLAEKDSLANADQIIAMQAPAVGGEAEGLAWQLENPLFADDIPKHALAIMAKAAKFVRRSLPSTAVGGGQEPEGLRSALALISKHYKCAEIWMRDADGEQMQSPKGGMMTVAEFASNALAQPTPPPLDEENQCSERCDGSASDARSTRPDKGDN